ncbi:MAG: hypothetical protein HND48_24240 [Chloroflexi bacterium]|nr:hypothetical protein [Chloroflexota bacterium]
MAFSLDGRHIATAGELAAITVWDAATGEVVREFQQGQGATVRLCSCLMAGWSAAANPARCRCGTSRRANRSAVIRTATGRSGIWLCATTACS